MHIQNVFRSGGIMAGLICLLTVQIVYAGAESTGAEAEGLVWPEVSTQAFQSGQSAFEVLPVAQADPDSDFGEDVNVNMATIDDYLGLTDAVYRDMRMTEDPYDYEAIGGDSYLSGMIEGNLREDHPTHYADPISAEILKWGFPGFDKGKLLINARAESVKTKSTFADSFASRRCVLPAAGFYEWDRKKEKVTFRLGDKPILYLAGIYRPYGAEKRFVVLTREANDSMRPVHDRMPLILSKEEVRPWVGNMEEAGAAIPA